MDQFFRNYRVDLGRSGYDLCVETGSVAEETRNLLTHFFHGTDPNRLIFACSATDALNLGIFGLLKEGDHVITCNIEHNSVLWPLSHLYKYGGVEVDYVPFDGQGFVAPEEFARCFRENSGLVAINHASNIIGKVQPIKKWERSAGSAALLYWYMLPSRPAKFL